MTAFGIPEEMLPGAERTTFANRAEARRDFFQHTIASEWELLETAMQERFVLMLPPEHKGIVLKFDTSIVEGMQETVDAKAARLRADLVSGAITPDEYRAEFGRQPMPDGIGAMPYVPSGTTPLSIIAQGEPEQPAPPVEEPEPDDDEEDGPRMLAELRCERGHLTGRNIIEGSEQYCRKCRVSWVAQREVVGVG
jgi:hypothetical protein